MKLFDEEIFSPTTNQRWSCSSIQQATISFEIFQRGKATGHTDAGWKTTKRNIADDPIRPVNLTDKRPFDNIITIDTSQHFQQTSFSHRWKRKKNFCSIFARRTIPTSGKTILTRKLFNLMISLLVDENIDDLFVKRKSWHLISLISDIETNTLQRKTFSTNKQNDFHQGENEEHFHARQERKPITSHCRAP